MSALPVAILWNDALFVLVLRFMNFSVGVHLAVGFKPETGEVISADVPLVGRQRRQTLRFGHAVSLELSSKTD